MLDLLTNFDVSLFRLINGAWIHPALDSFFFTITDIAIMQFPLAIAMVAILIKGSPRTRYAILFAAVIVVIADMIGQDLKIAVGRRPFFTLDHVRWQTSDGSSRDNSFPSNHAVNNFAAATALFWHFRRKRWAPLLFVIPIIVCYSRVYVGVHYPSDVLGGALIGAFISAGFLALASWKPLVRFSPEERYEGIGYEGTSILFVLCLSLYRISIVSRGQIPLGAFEVLDVTGPFGILAPIKAVSVALFGMDDLAVRGPSIICGIVSSYICWRIVREAGGSRRSALIAMVALNLSPFVALAAVRGVPAAASLCFSLGSILYLVRMIRGRTPSWLAFYATFSLAAMFSPAALLMTPGFAYVFMKKQHLRRAFLSSYWRMPGVLLVCAAVVAGVDYHFARPYRYSIWNLAGFCGLIYLLVSAAWYIHLYRRKESNPSLRFIRAIWIPSLVVGVPVAFVLPDPISWLAIPSALLAIAWSRSIGAALSEVSRRPRLGAGMGMFAAFGIFTFVLVHDRSGWWSVYRPLKSIGIELPLRLDPAYEHVEWDELQEKLWDAGLTWKYRFEPEELNALAMFYASGSVANDGALITVDPDTAPPFWETRPEPDHPIVVEIKDKRLVYRRLLAERLVPGALEQDGRRDR